MNILKDKSVLVVDDEHDLREIIGLELEFHDAQVFQASNITEAKEILQEKKIDLIISDIRMPGGTGMELLDFVRQKNVINPKFILITGFADVKIQDAFHLGAEDLIHKPFPLKKLTQVISNAMSSKIRKELNDVKNFSSITFTKNFEDAVKDGEIKFGRGGFSIFLSRPVTNISVGNLDYYELSFKNKKLRIKGEIKWAYTEVETKKHSIGLRVFEEDRATQKELSAYESAHKFENLRPFIPKA